MASDHTPARFITGCSTGSGRGRAEAMIVAVTAPEPPLRLLLGAPALELPAAGLDRLRADVDAGKEATLGADRAGRREAM